MTYTVVARCQHSGRIGLGIATYSIAVGGYCPFFMGNEVVLSTQAFANPALGPLALESLGRNSAPSKVILDLTPRSFQLATSLPQKVTSTREI